MCVLLAGVLAFWYQFVPLIPGEKNVVELIISFAYNYLKINRLCTDGIART